ncbi:bifunctional glycosyltransferase family 2/GtrA family protein [Leptospira noguchii]|uniref:GtrA-like protein n=1 Tax=Leptospira noguchii serovar Autumnalis str. ZUN142 TaxID=1085540 RepID=M6UJW7_9LEPT|nr:bifunctional glycosyltransferase family 2/GtrA family protein [Leptospira noguchii]EKR74389.1 GtrA-like protein [Leptospira noguchii str. 2006001870]EMO43091.1 GtrA-like protein [Leptospira noguchii serovar Autumnalis str. ZUN142]
MFESVSTQIPIIIPAYNPDERLIQLVDELILHDISNIVVINDGSKESCAPIFQKLTKFKQCHLLHHATNLGKGRALKTAINYCMLTFSETLGIITADADGQHKVSDIIKVMQSLLKYPNQLILGSRKFDKDVPFRSLLGNRITSIVFSFLVGNQLLDTQTGLRGIPAKFLSSCLRLSGERYEYEMNMLISTKEHRLKIFEETIETLYIENNKSSHFNPLIDSARIYFLFFRFVFSSILTSALDFCVFTVAFLSLSNLLISIIFSRTVAGAFNFFVNKRFVFKDPGGIIIEFVKYALLVAGLGLLAFVMIHYLHSSYGWNVIAAKAFIDTIFFLVSFAIQREFVFGNNSEEER